MKRFFCRFAAVIVAVVMIFGYVPIVKAVSTVPQNVQVPMPMHMLNEFEHVSEFVNSFFPDKPDLLWYEVSAWKQAASMHDGIYMPEAVAYFMIQHHDGTVWTWGINFRGGIGDGTTINRYLPVMVLDNVF